MAFHLARNTRSGAQFSPHELPVAGEPIFTEFIAEDGLRRFEEEELAFLQEKAELEARRRSDSSFSANVSAGYADAGQNDGSSTQPISSSSQGSFSSQDATSMPHPIPSPTYRPLPGIPPPSSAGASASAGAHARSSQRHKEKQRIKRSKDRAAAQAKAGTSLKACSLKYRARAVPVEAPLVFGDLRPTVTLPAWRALGENSEEKSSRGLTYTQEELIKERGMKLIDWDGRTPRPILDRVRRVVGVLAGQPRGGAWQSKVNAEAAHELEHAREHLNFTDEQIHHRRGPFPAMDYGISFGGGQEASLLHII